MSTDPDASALTATDATEAFTVTAAVTPVQVDLGLDAFLTSLEQEAKTAGDKTLDPPLDPEVVQHRVFVVLIVAFGLFEWGVRNGRVRSGGAALVFPLITAIGGGLLLTHSHALANVKDQFLVEISHVPLALLGILAGWTRWLELRLPSPGNRLPAWAWPVCFVLIGLLLLSYREA